MVDSPYDGKAVVIPREPQSSITHNVLRMPIRMYPLLSRLVTDIESGPPAGSRIRGLLLDGGHSDG